MRNWLLALAAALVCITAARARSPATADQYFYVDPHGLDCLSHDNPCTMPNTCLNLSAPCKTIHYAYSRAKVDFDYVGSYQAYVKMAAGTYTHGVTMSGQPVGTHTVNFIGQQSQDASCTLSQAQQVIIEGGGEAIFDAQDLAIPVIRCLTLRATCVQVSGGGCVERSKVTGINCRQTPAVDMAYIVFDALEQGISAAQACGEVNISGDAWIANNMTVFASANGMSMINVAGPITVLNSVKITHPFRAYQGAIIEFTGKGTVVNGDLVGGSPANLVWRDGKLITNGAQLPGGCTQANAAQPGRCW